MITDIAAEIFASQLFSQEIGASMEIQDDIVIIGLDIAPKHLQQHGFVHGGVLSYLADNSLTFAGGIALSSDALTSEYKINYICPAKGIKLIAKAHAISAGSRQSVCQSKIFVQDKEGVEKLCAYALGTIVRV